MLNERAAKVLQVLKFLCPIHLRIFEYHKSKLGGWIVCFVFLFQKGMGKIIDVFLWNQRDWTWIALHCLFLRWYRNLLSGMTKFTKWFLWSVQVAAINPNHPLAQMPLPPSMKNCIQLAACEANELLPMIPDLPADLFTSCLTTPIKIALRW